MPEVRAAAAVSEKYPVLPRNFVQDKQYEAHQSLSVMQRIVTRWWSNVLGNVPHDPHYLVRALRGTAKTLSALADQVETEIRKAEAEAQTKDAAE